MKKILYFLSIFGVISLAGCASYNNHFDCPAGQGAGCKSLSYVNKMVDRGKIGGENYEGDEHNEQDEICIDCHKKLGDGNRKKAQYQESSKENPHHFESNKGFQESDLFTTQQVNSETKSNKIIKIYFHAYKDDEGYHPPEILYVGGDNGPN